MENVVRRAVRAVARVLFCLIKPHNQRLQPTAFGAGMRGAFCQQSLWLLKRVLPKSAAAEPQAVSPLFITKGVEQHENYRCRKDEKDDKSFSPY